MLPDKPIADQRQVASILIISPEDIRNKKPTIGVQCLLTYSMVTGYSRFWHSAKMNRMPIEFRSGDKGLTTGLTHVQKHPLHQTKQGPYMR